MSLASVAAILASFAAMPASAVESNVYSISYETLTAAVTTADGDVVPAGSVAVTVSIDENTGFTSNTLTLDVAGADVLADTEGKPIVQNGTVLAGALTGSAVVGDAVCVTTASADACSADGALFTIFLAAGSEADEVSIAESAENSATSLASVPAPISVNDYVVDYYTVGDADGSEVADATDASLILLAIKEYGSSMTVEYVAANKSTTFPNAETADAPDANEDGRIASADAQDILDYAALVGAENEIPEGMVVGAPRLYFE